MGADGAAAASGSGSSTCGDIKNKYKEAQCCGGEAGKEIGALVVPFNPTKRLNIGENPCKEKKPKPGDYGGAFDNFECASKQAEQSGADVSKNVADRMDPQIDASGYNALSVPYWKGNSTGAFGLGPLCPVNVHWHLGAEHRSKGEYDEQGKSPQVGGLTAATAAPTRRLESEIQAMEDEFWENREEKRWLAAVRYGFACHHYDANDKAFTTPYEWKHCIGMEVGATYEVHWPHSVLGACHTPWQYQSPFYDGVLCHATDEIIGSCATNKECLYNAVGVQAQIFTIVNDESYYFPDLIRGMIVSAPAFGQDVAYYTGSFTGSSRNNIVCSAFTPITWQVDRKCHKISASTFDKMCADMKQQYDDMSIDLKAHGARELVAGRFTANGQGTLVGR